MAKKRANGEGTVRKRADGRWEGSIIIGKKANGKPITKSVFAKTQKELMPKLHTLIKQYRGVELSENSGMTLAAWFDRWFAEYAEPTLRPDTVSGYHSDARKICKVLGDKQLRHITTPDVQKMYNKLKRSGREREHPIYGTSLADSSVRSIHMLLHEVMDAAVRASLIAKNPTNGTTIPKNNYKDMKVLNDEQLDIFMEAIRNEPLWYDFFYTELTTGLRRGEICGLRWEDFDENNRTLKVQRSLNGKMQIGETKTETGRRMILLPDSTYDILQKRKIDKLSEWIFPSLLCPKKPTSPSAAYHKMKELLKDAGLPNIRFHDLRHTFATHAMKNGVDAKTLSGILGHTNASFTLDTYTHITTDMQKNASGIVGDFMEDLFGKELKPWEEEEKTDLVL